MMNDLKIVYIENEYKLYEYKPRLLHLQKYKLQQHSFSTMLRYVLDYLRKGRYYIYYLEYKGTIIGECMVKPGGGRFKFSKASDIMIGGPYYVIPEYRGRGLSEVLIRKSLENCSYPWNNAYDYIKKDNLASIRVTEKCGFRKIAEINIDRITHTVKMAENNGRFAVYQLSHQEYMNRR